jgi:hypothetical protein
MRELVPIAKETRQAVSSSLMCMIEEERETVSTLVREEGDFRHKDIEIMDDPHSVVSIIYIVDKGAPYRRLVRTPSRQISIKMK